MNILENCMQNVCKMLLQMHHIEAVVSNVVSGVCNFISAVLNIYACNSFCHYYKHIQVVEHLLL